MDDKRELTLIVTRLNEVKQSGYGELTLKINDHKLTHIKRDIMEQVK